MIVDCISDLHGHYPETDSGDLLIIAGDCTGRDQLTQWAEFFGWLKAQKYTHKVMIGGNHDNILQNMFPKNQEEADANAELKEFLDEHMDDETNFHYLCDSGVELDGFKIWGSPWTKRFMNQNPDCMAFTFRSNADMYDKFCQIPHDTDILITHSPPEGVLDKTYMDRAGCPRLRHLVERTIKPKLHVFGHIHEGYGRIKRGDTIFVNAGHMSQFYEPIRPPIRVIL